MPPQKYWIKFSNNSPELWRCHTFEEFWHRMRETILREPRLGYLEWVICD